MAAWFGLSIPLFRTLYAWRRYGVLSLRERSNYDCVFLDRNPFRCSIYRVRPSQCRTFPFWPDVLENKRSWDRYAESCPGMNRGAFHDRDEIASNFSGALIPGDAKDKD
jgi:Fe-S-cluster containining protein